MYKVSLKYNLRILKTNIIINTVLDFLNKLRLINPAYPFSFKEKKLIFLNKKIKNLSKKFNQDIFFTSHTGLFMIKNNVLTKLYTGGIFFGLEKYKNYLIFSFNKEGHGKGEICFINLEKKNFKIEKKIFFSNQYIHQVKVKKNNLFIINSSLYNNIDELIKYDLINKKFYKLETNINNKIRIHLNSISFIGKKIVLLFHNMTSYTEIPSAVYLYDKNFKKEKKILNNQTFFNAHNIFILKDKINLLDSSKSTVFVNNLRIKIRKYFLRGVAIINNSKLLIGCNKHGLNRHSSATTICELNLNTKHKKYFNLGNFGSICEILVIKKPKTKKI